MSNYNNIRGKNQRNSNQDWNNDYEQNRNRNSDDDRQDDDQRNQHFGGTNEHNQQGGIGNYGQGDRGNYFGSDSGRSFERQHDQQRNDRWNNDQNFSSSYGSDRGQGRGRNDSWDFDRSSNNNNDFGGNRNFSRSQSGNSGYGNFDNDRNRNQNQDRGWWDKTRDEVSSWFGDDEADRRRRQDNNQSQSQSHRGKGPKGYTRSDERIKEDINDRLSDDHHIDASEINVTVTNGEVVLSGSVNDRNAKRHAEDLTESISGVKNVENRIRVGNSNDSNSNASGNQSNQASKIANSSANAGNFETKKS